MINQALKTVTTADYYRGSKEPVMRIVKNPIPAAKSFWDVTESYCSKRPSKIGRRGRTDHSINQSKLDFVRKLETKGNIERKQLTVNINGVENIYTLGKKNEYYLNGQPLTKTLEVLALSSGNKISIR